MKALPETQSNYFLIFTALLFTLAASLQLLVNATSESVKTESKPVSAVEESAKLLGGLRSGLAAYLWVKTEDMHHRYYEDLSKEQEFVPIYRIITWLDPKFIPAYDVGSYTLTLYGKKKEGLKFAMEGLEKNPDSPLLNLTVGQIYLLKFKNPEKGIIFIKRAIKLEKDPENLRIDLNYLRLAEKIKARSRPRSSSSAPKQPPSVP